MVAGLVDDTDEPRELACSMLDRIHRRAGTHRRAPYARVIPPAQTGVRAAKSSGLRHCVEFGGVGADEAHAATVAVSLEWRPYSQRAGWSLYQLRDGGDLVAEGQDRRGTSAVAGGSLGPTGAGIAVPDGVIDDYERVLSIVDLASIAVRERVTRHDVKARIEEFNDGGHQHVHKGWTRRDLTENVEQLQIRQSLQLVYACGSRVAARLAERAVTYRDVVMVGRSHNVAAQATTLGKAVRLGRRRDALALGRDCPS